MRIFLRYQESFNLVPGLWHLRLVDEPNMPQERKEDVLRQGKEEIKRGMCDGGERAWERSHSHVAGMPFYRAITTSVLASCSAYERPGSSAC